MSPRPGPMVEPLAPSVRLESAAPILFGRQLTTAACEDSSHLPTRHHQGNRQVCSCVWQLMRRRRRMESRADWRGVLRSFFHFLWKISLLRNSDYRKWGKMVGWGWGGAAGVVLYECGSNFRTPNFCSGKRPTSGHRLLKRTSLTSFIIHAVSRCPHSRDNTWTVAPLILKFPIPKIIKTLWRKKGKHPFSVEWRWSDAKLRNKIIVWGRKSPFYFSLINPH